LNLTQTFKQTDLSKSINKHLIQTSHMQSNIKITTHKTNKRFLIWLNTSRHIECTIVVVSGFVDLPQNTWKAQQNTTKTNWILHKHLNKHRNNERMWNLCFYVYLFIIIIYLILQEEITSWVIALWLILQYFWLIMNKYT
jgi:hypothetical protein